MGAIAAAPTLEPEIEIEIEGHVFPSPLANPPGSSKSYVLGGAGERGLEIGGRFIKFTAIGVYLEEGEAVAALAPRWNGKSAEELRGSADFYRDVVTGPFEKFIKVTMIVPLTGFQYSEKLTDNCVSLWKATGTYTEASANAVEKFKEFFKDAAFPPGASILFTQSPSGTLTVVFSMDEKAVEVIEDKQLSEAVLESIIGEDGVSPATKESLANRVAALLRACDCEEEKAAATASVEEKVACTAGDASPAVALEA